MSYRPSANPPRTAWARHLDQVMRERGWSRVRLFEEVRADLGLGPKSRTALLPIHEDKEPTPAQAEVLTRHFGEPPADAAPAPPEDDVSLAAAIRGLTAELAEARRERAELAGKLARIEAVLDVLAPQAMRDVGAPVARHSSAGSSL